MYEYGDTKSKYQSIEEVAMTVRVEKKGRVWTVIHSRPQARNAMDPESADALVEAFTAFDRDEDAAVAVLWGEGGVYCRRWGVPLIDGGTVRLPRIVGMGRALEIILTGRKLPAEESLRIGACEHVVADGESRQFAEAMAHEIARFPQVCLRADRRSAYMQQGLTLREAMRKEWYNGLPAFEAEGIAGAERFASGKGRHGDFRDI